MTDTVTPTSPGADAAPAANGSLSRLAMSGNLLAAPPLHGRSLAFEEYDGDAWRSSGDLALFPNTAFLNQEKLYNVEFHPDTQSLAFSYGKGDAHRAGRLFFTHDFGAFIGTVSGANGTARAVRGTNYTVVYHTRRRLMGSSAPLEAWEDLKIDNRWEGTDELPELHTYYFLGKEDVSPPRTSVTNVNRKTWETTLEMVPDDLLGDQDCFQVVIAFGGVSFSGTYTDADGKVYEWQGDASPRSVERNTADVERFFAYDGPPLSRMQPAGMRTRALRLADGTGPTLSVQDLNSITSIYEVNTTDGSNKTVDVAQTKTGEFFNFSLMNGVGEPWITDLFGRRFDVPGRVDTIFNSNKRFFEENSTLAVGQMLYDNLKTDPTHKDVIARIKPEALKDGWKALSESQDYATVTQQLYLEGYRTAVPGLRPYLEDDPKGWALRYYQYLTSPLTLGIWQTQIASQAFANIKQQMYEWYVKLSVLDPDLHSFSKMGEVDPAGGDTQTRATLGQQMLSTAYSALLGVSYTKARWKADIAPILMVVLENAANGNMDGVADIRDALVKQNIEEMRKTLQDMISTFDNVTKLAENIFDVMTVLANKNPERPMVRAGDDLYEGLGRRFDEQSPARRRWDGFKDKAPKVLGVLMYGAAAGYLIYSIVEDAKNPDITPEKIVQDVGLGLISLGLLSKGASAFMALGVGDWLRMRSLQRVGFMSEAAGAVSKWFTKEGVQPVGRLGKAFTKIFGESYTEFFSRRLGPAIAVFGIAMSAAWLYRAIKTGDVRDIVFEAVGLFFALADVVFIGLELMSFAWAGPVGLVIAGIGLLVVLVQLIWNLCDRPKMPPDPIERFVTGPMKDKGFAS